MRLKDNRNVIAPVTVEDGEPYCLAHRRYGKGQQLKVDSVDFPTLGRTGLHSAAELDSKERITGRPVWLIDLLGRPGALSDSGFLAQDESVISVLKSDNHLVEGLGLTHPILARPLFRLWNLALIDLETRVFGLGREGSNIDYVLYNERKIRLDIRGTKGYQESIFHDEIQGGSDIHIWRDLEPEEQDYLRAHYGHLGAERLSELTEKLSHLHFGEMVPLYVMRYGFYEGHVPYRADPISIAFIFRLKVLAEIDEALARPLDAYLLSPGRVP